MSMLSSLRPMRSRTDFTSSLSSVPLPSTSTSLHTFESSLRRAVGTPRLLAATYTRLVLPAYHGRAHRSEHGIDGPCACPGSQQPSQRGRSRPRKVQDAPTNRRHARLTADPSPRMATGAPPPPAASPPATARSSQRPVATRQQPLTGAPHHQAELSLPAANYSLYLHQGVAHQAPAPTQRRAPAASETPGHQHLGPLYVALSFNTATPNACAARRAEHLRRLVGSPLLTSLRSQQTAAKKSLAEHLLFLLGASKKTTVGKRH